MPVRTGAHKFPKSVGIEVTGLVELAYELGHTMVWLEGGKLPNIAKVAVESAILYSSHHTPCNC